MSNAQNSMDVLPLHDPVYQEYQRRTIALASATHELKTPLAVMAGYTELLLNENVGSLNPRQRKILAEMQLNAERLQRFIDDFLAYGAVETGEIKLHLEPCDINACVNEVCNIWVPRFQEKGVACYLLPSRPVDPFPFDQLKIQHVISNLLHNAQKFTPAGGAVWLSIEPEFWDRRNYLKPASTAKERRAKKVARHNVVKISVADTGPGIAPEYHQEIFNHFLKLPHTPSSEEGSGLGLAIARCLVNAHKGKIWIESEVGLGSKFSFYLPFHPLTGNESKTQ